MKKLLTLFLILNLYFPSLCFGVADELYVTVAGAGDNSGTTWANAMALADWETDAGTACASEAGDKYYVEEGTYTLTEAWNCPNDGTTTNMIEITGVKSGTTNEPPVLADWAFTTARPLIAAAANTFDFDDRWLIRNIQVTTTAAEGISASISSYIENIKSTNSSGTGDRMAIVIDSAGGQVLFSEAVATNGRAIQLNTQAIAYGNYVHDSVNGIDSGAGGSGISVYMFNVVDTMSGTGFRIFGGASRIISNTVSACAIGIELSNETHNIVINNLIDSSSTGGIEADALLDSNILDWNNYNGNLADVTNVTKGFNATAVDPQFTDADNKDFDVGTNVKATGSPQPGTNTGLSNSVNNLDQGAMQREEAGGATTDVFGMIQ